MPGNFRIGAAFPGSATLTAVGTDAFSARTDAVDTISSEVVNSLANSIVKAQKAILANQPMFALGDLIIGGVSGAPNRLGAGFERQVLKIIGNVPQWADQLDGGLVHVGFTSSLLNPSLTELPNDKQYGIHKNTITNDVFFAFNDNGTIKSLQITDATSTITAAGFALNSGAINSRTSTYTLLASDNGKVVVMNSASNLSLIVPIGLAVGFSCRIVQQGTGQITIVASGTTVNSISGLKLQGQHGAAFLISYEENVFNASGNLTT